MAGNIGDLQVKAARQHQGPPLVPGMHRRVLVFDMALQGRERLIGHASCGHAGDAGLDQASGLEDFVRFAWAGAGDERAAILLDGHKLRMGERLQRRPHDGAADAEYLADLVLDQLGAGGDPVFEDRALKAGRNQFRPALRPCGFGLFCLGRGLRCVHVGVPEIRKLLMEDS